MKKCILLFSISLLLIFPKSQFAQWTTVYDDGKYYIVGIEFKDENTGFAGGFNMESDSAVIIRTTDGGDNWEEIFTLPEGYAGPYCFDFINDTLAISGGQDGTIYKSSDGGNNWEYISSIGGLNDIFTIRFFNETIGLASGMRTTDGGYTWTWMDIGITSDIFLVDDSSGFATSWDGIFYTSDFGESWLKVSPDPEEQYNSVCMATDLVGYAAKNPDKIYKTTDGGMSWFLIDSLSVYEIKQIRFTDENTGFILVNNGSMRVMKTTDGGNSWDYVLFGNEYSYQMAFANNETILVPTVNGMMYKTSNGGGDPILPRHTEIDWFSKIGGSAYGGPTEICIDSTSQPYIIGRFYDSLIVDESTIQISAYPQNKSCYIIKYNTWGTIDWSRVIEKQYEDVYAASCAVDNNNNFYLVYGDGYPGIWKLRKFSEEGDSLWTTTLETNDSSHYYKININIDGHIIISGSFLGTYSYDNNSIHTDNVGVFILELDQDGNFISLDRVVEVLNWIQDINFDINEEGSICLSFLAVGSTYINEDTIGGYGYLLLYLDPDKNLVWHNNEFNAPYKYIFNTIFSSNSTVLLRGRDIIDDHPYHVVNQYSDQGIKTDSAYINISGPGFFQGNTALCTTANNRILTAGNYRDLAILEDDTLYGFSQNNNSFVYTLSDNLKFVKSSHISGTRNVSSIVENQHNSYMVGVIEWENIILANDTIFQNEDDHYFIAKLNSIITPVYERKSYDMVSVYPNPSSGIFNVSIPNGSSKYGYFEIYSITGQKVYESILSERNKTINISNLDKGIYFIQFNLNGKIYSQKIIIQ